jgi:hypothetical protein
VISGSGAGSFFSLFRMTRIYPFLVLLGYLAVGSVLVDAQTRLSLPTALPSFNQAYRGASGNTWGNCRMGTDGCPDRIETAGCLITAFAMILDYYRIELFIPASSSCTGRTRTGMDPGILNDWLREHSGYGRCVQDLAGNCCLEWTRLPTQITLSFHENRSEVDLDVSARRTIDRALIAGYPIVAGVHWGEFCHGAAQKTEDCHWVVITGKDGLTYNIVDPYNPDTSSREGVRTTLRRGTRGNYIIDRFVVVSGPVPRGNERPASDETDLSGWLTVNRLVSLLTVGLAVLLTAVLYAVVVTSQGG